MSTLGKGGTDSMIGAVLLIPNQEPEDWGDILPIYAEVFAYLIARFRNGIQQPLTIDEIGRDVGIHVMTVEDALVELQDRGFLEMRLRQPAGDSV